MPANELEEFEFRARAEKEAAQPAAAAPAPQPGPLDKLRGDAAPVVRGALDVAGFPGDMAHAAVVGGTKLTQAYDRLRGDQQVPDAPPAVQAPGTSEWIKNKAERAGILPPPSANPSLTERGIEKGSEFLLGGGPKLLQMAAREVPALAREAGSAVMNIPAIRTLRGVEAPIAKDAAAAASREAVSKAATIEEANAQWGELHQKALEQHRGALEAHLAELQKLPETVKDLDTQGNTLRGAFTGAINSAKAARKAAVDPLYAEADALGSTARVDTKAIEAPLTGLLKEASGIKGIEGPVNDALTAIRGRTTAPPPGMGLVDASGRPFAQAAAEPAKTARQLAKTSRALKEWSYSQEAEGATAEARLAVRTAAKEIDTAIERAVPKYAEANARYKALSEPIDSLNTRLGKVLSSTEGGFQGDAYAKTAAADLPGKLFGKKEGIELLTDALAGGKSASVEARAQAAKQVDTMVENWLLKSVGTDKAAAGVTKLRAPGMEAALTAAPGAAKRVMTRFDTMADLEKNSAALTKQAEGVAKRTAASAEVGAGLRKDIELGDTLVKSDSVLERTAGYNAYRNAITRAYRQSGLLTAEEFNAAQHLFDRAATLEERTNLARSLLTKLGVGAGFVAGEEATRKLLF
jgi:hypothetical protein